MPGGAVATALSRASDAKRADLTVGRVIFGCEEQMQRWNIRCTDTALVFPTAESSSLSARSDSAGKAAPMELQLTFDAWTSAAGWAARRTEVDEMKFARIV